MQDASKPIWINQQSKVPNVSTIPNISALPNVSTIPNISALPNVSTLPCIFVATPVHSECSIHYTQALLTFQQKCLANNILVSFSLLKSSLVTQGRNLCVNAFMEECKNFTYSHMLFIDSDIEFSFETIMKLVAADKDVVAAPYPLKSLDWNKIAHRIKTRNIEDGEIMSKHGFTWPIKLEGRNQISVTGGIAEVSHAPTGCMLIKRQVFEKMIKELPELKINQPTIVNGRMTEKEFMYNFFDCYHEPETKKYYGEDFGFCKRWSEIGGKCHILVDEYITHVGEYRYTGRLMDDLDFKKD